MDSAPKDQVSWMVCHDGSKSSCDALQETIGSLMKGEDTLTVGHVFNYEKEKYLKFDLKKDYIRGTSEATCVQLGKRYFYTEVEHNERHSDTIKSLLNEIAKERKCDIQVVGFHGRKGPKLDPTVMGTAVSYMSVNAVCPVLILKDPIDRSTKPNLAYTHAICTDGSKQSNKALRLICDVMQPQDKIVLIICEQGNIDTKSIIHKSMEKLEQMDAHENVEVEVLKSEYGKKTSDIIRDAIQAWTDKKYIDFIYVGNKGADFSSKNEKNYLGSVTGEIIRHTKLNTYFIP